MKSFKLNPDSYMQVDRIVGEVELPDGSDKSWLFLGLMINFSWLSAVMKKLFVCESQKCSIK